jgi:hypothetical protein
MSIGKKKQKKKQTHTLISFCYYLHVWTQSKSLMGGPTALIVYAVS